MSKLPVQMEKKISPDFGLFKILSARYLKNYLREGLEPWSTDRGWWIDYLIKFFKNSPYFSGVMALSKFGHFKLVKKISQKLFELGDWIFVSWGWWVDYLFKFFLKIHLIFPEVWPFENFGILNNSARYLENYLNLGLEPWSADRGWLVDYLIKFFKKITLFFRSYGPLKIWAF